MHMIYPMEVKHSDDDSATLTCHYQLMEVLLCAASMGLQEMGVNAPDPQISTLYSSLRDCVEDLIKNVAKANEQAEETNNG